MKTINVANEQSRKVTREKLGKVEIENLQTEILELTGEQREARMKTYRRLVSASADQLVYFTRS